MACSLTRVRAGTDTVVLMWMYLVLSTSEAYCRETMFEQEEEDILLLL